MQVSGVRRADVKCAQYTVVMEGHVVVVGLILPSFHRETHSCQIQCLTRGPEELYSGTGKGSGMEKDVIRGRKKIKRL